MNIFTQKSRVVLFIVLLMSMVMVLALFEFLVERDRCTESLAEPDETKTFVKEPISRITPIDTIKSTESAETAEQVTQETEEVFPEPEIRTGFPIISSQDQWATITIESAGVYNIPVFHGSDNDLSMRGICHFMNSRFPGQNGRIVLYGHVGIYRFFQRLETMSVGDRVVLNTIYGDYIYEVIRTEIHDASDISWTLPLEEEVEDELVCYTCYPFHTSKTRTQRFAIICKRLSGDTWISDIE